MYVSKERGINNTYIYNRHFVIKWKYRQLVSYYKSSESKKSSLFKKYFFCPCFVMLLSFFPSCFPFNLFPFSRVTLKRIERKNYPVSFSLSAFFLLVFCNLFLPSLMVHKIRFCLAFIQKWYLRSVINSLVNK